MREGVVYGCFPCREFYATFEQVVLSSKQVVSLQRVAPAMTLKIILKFMIRLM